MANVLVCIPSCQWFIHAIRVYCTQAIWRREDANSKGETIEDTDFATTLIEFHSFLRSNLASC